MIDPTLAAEIAARYNVSVPETVTVQNIPRGKTSPLNEFVWNGFALVPKVKESRGEAMKRKMQAVYKQARIRNAIARKEAAENRQAAVAKPRIKVDRSNDPRMIAAKEQMERAKAFAGSGRTLSEMADYMQMDRKYCAAYCRKYGIQLLKVARTNGGGYSLNENSARGQAIKARLDDWTHRLSQGETIHDIAAISGKSVKTVRDFLRRHNVDFQAMSRQGINESRAAHIAARKAQFLALAQQGLGVYAIKKAMRISSQTAYGYAREMGMVFGSARVSAVTKAALERRIKVKELCEQGVPTAEIAERLGVPKRVIQRDRMALHVTQRHLRAKRSDFKSVSSRVIERRNRVQAMRASGMKVADIAEKEGVSVGRIFDDLRAIAKTRVDGVDA